MTKITDAKFEAACRAMCKSNGTGQCAPICLSHFSTSTQGGACPEATRVYGRSAKAALEAAEAVRVKTESNLQKVQIPTSTIPEGFIPWHGGECPVDGKTIGDVLLRSGLRLEQAKMGHQSWDYWQSASKTDIIAYRIHKPADFRLEAGKYYVDARGKRTHLVRGLTAPMPGLFHDGGARVWKADGTAKTPGDPDLLALSSNQENNHG